MDYNDENLIKLYKEKMSFSEIGRTLNVTASKANGRINRMIKKGLMKHDGRSANVHPTGKVSKRTKDEQPKEIVFQPKKYTIRTRPFGYTDPTKAQLRDMLRDAVNNTK